MSLGITFEKDLNALKRMIKKKYNFLINIKTSVEKYDEISRHVVFILELDKLGDFIIKHKIPEPCYIDMVIYGKDEFKVIAILSAAKDSIFELLDSKQKEYEIISLRDELESKLKTKTERKVSKI